MKCILVCKIIISYLSLISLAEELDESYALDCRGDEINLIFQGNADFTTLFLLEAHRLYPSKSLIMSPFSVLPVTGIMMRYAKCDTYTQLKNMLNVRRKDDIRCAFPSLTSQLKNQRNVTINLTSKIFATNRHPITKNFLEDTKEVFNAEAESVDFNNSEEAAERINSWVAKETNNRIEQIIPPNAFDSNTRLVLANAIYFLGNWSKKFDSSQTSNRDFYVNENKVIKIPTMYQRSKFEYAEINDFDFKVLQMYYSGGNFSFLVFLPNKIEGLSNLINNIQEPDLLEKVLNKNSPEDVVVYLPKFKIESEFDLTVIMKKAGVKDIFNSTLSNLDAILVKYEPLHISAAKQKAFIEIDEKGTEAAAANAVVITRPPRPSFEPPPKSFVADRPFVYFILYKRAPIFCGKFQPTA